MQPAEPPPDYSHASRLPVVTASEGVLVLSLRNSYRTSDQKNLHLRPPPVPLAVTSPLDTSDFETSDFETSDFETSDFETSDFETLDLWLWVG